MSITPPPPFLLDALKDSITSRIFIDTKFYVFSRRDPSGRVGAPRPLYCNSRVLETVPYFATLFSDGFSEGQLKDIDEGFPSGSVPYTEYYDYSSDSDLEDESPCSGEDEGEEQSRSPQGSDSRAPPIAIREMTLGLPSRDDEVERNHRWGNDSVRIGKVAFIRDMAAVTFESMIYFLYTGKISFAPFASDPHHELPAEERAGDWRTAQIPSPSAKSVYRLADKYDIPTLKERAKVHILNNLSRCNIVDEVFSSFSLSFPEILSVQISQLVSKMKEESTEGAESDTRRQLREKIAALPQPQLTRATDALTMIWDGVAGLLDPPAPELRKPIPSLTPPLIWHWVIYPLSSNWNRTQLALLKSIPTGTFIDVRFYAYNAIRDNLPVDPKPLFTSSIVVGEWENAIMTMTQTAGPDPRGASPMDGLTDDYEYWHGEPPETLHEEKSVEKLQTDTATAAEIHKVLLMSGAWKTWMSLFSFAFANEMTFTPLQTSTYHRDLAADPKMQWNQSCSARSMYSLSTALGIDSVKERALNGIQSMLSASNIAQELFTQFALNHKEIMDIEIEYFKNSTERDPKLLMAHIQKTASAEPQPFFSTTLSLIYDKLVESIFTQPAASGSGLDKMADLERGEQSVADAEPAPAVQAPDPTSGAPSPSRPNTQPVPDPHTDPEPVPMGAVWLECFQCSERARLRDLYNGLRCPRCPPRNCGRGRPFMQCPSCSLVRGIPKDHCVRNACQARFA